MYNLTILLRKAYATKECGNDVRELRCWGGFGKIVRTPGKILATPLQIYKHVVADNLIWRQTSVRNARARQEQRVNKSQTL